jgi:hypothetical protein
MAIDLEAYTADGLLTGSALNVHRTLDLLTSGEPAVLEGAVLAAFNGPAEQSDGLAEVDVDDLLVVVSADAVTPFHAVWHRLMLDVGPYRVRGELPSLPGFDPSRAIARPGGPFVLIGHATVELRGAGLRSGINEHTHVWVNRYAVDHVESDIDLSVFFPGAHGTAALRENAIA